jgi:integrase
MEQTFERVMRRDDEGNFVPEKHLYRRKYKGADGKWTTRYSARFTDWSGKVRNFRLGEKLSSARNKLAELHRKNDAEFDFDKDQAERAARGMTFSTWAAECKGKANQTHAKQLETFFGTKLLTNICDDDVEGYRAKRSTEKIIRGKKKTSTVTVSQTTINKEVSTLRKLLRLARKKGIHDKVTAFKMEKERSRKRTLNTEEYKKLLDNCDRWLRRACVLARETSLCRSDLLELTWSQIKTHEGIIERDRNKTDVEHAIPIATPELWEVIEELQSEKKRLPNVDGLVLTINGQPIPENKFEYRFRKARKAAGIGDFRFHDLRHCAITRWAAAGIPTAAAMQAAGHKSVASHKKYQNLQRDELKNAFRKLSQNLLQEPSTGEQNQRQVI